MPLDKQPVTHTFNNGINTTTAAEFLPNNQARYILNCNSLSTATGDVGIITNVKGNVLIPNALPTGTNETIGYAVDEETNNLYYFNWNSQGYHGIYRFNDLNRTIIPVILNLIDTGGVDILRFDKNFRILHADVVRNDLLYWVDGINAARKTNIKKCLDKSTSGYGTVIREEFINAYKVAPVYSPDAVYFSDTSKPFNRLYGKLYKFISRFIYDDGEKSNWSDYGNVPLPANEPISGITSIPTNNNGIKITVETGSQIVKQVEIAMQSTDSSLTDGGFLNYVTIAVLDKSKLGISNDSTYTYSFYNDGSYTVTDPEKVIRPYSFLPRRPLCQSFLKNALAYSNFKEGFPTVTIDAEVTVAYQDLFVESGTENEFNEPVFVRTAHTFAYVGGGRPRRTYETLEIGSDVKKGNVFSLLMKAPPESELSTLWNYTATAFDTSQTVANYFRQRIAEWHINNTPAPSPSEISVDGSQTASFSYELISTEYFDGIPTVTPIQFNSLKDTGESIQNIKLGSSLKLGIMYEDSEGRKSLVYTNDSLVIGIKTINELGGVKKPVITLKIKHRPPVWAKYWQVVRSNDLIYKDYIQMLIQDVTEVEASDNGDYLDLVVGSLFTYQKIHENTVIQYSFEKGDRIRLIGYFDEGTFAKSYYPFYESEVLSYKDTVTDIKTESAATTENSPNVVIGGATSAENIGKVILISGVERTIASVVNGNTYSVDRNYVETKTHASYSIIDRRGTIRVRKPPVSVIANVNNLSLVEIYKPSSGVSSTETKTYNEFDQKYPVLNWGTETRSHGGNSQDQDGTSDSTLSSTPAIILIDDGTAYVRNREFPITNVVPGAQVLISDIEDAGYSDYYNSTFNNNGRVTVEDTGDGEVHFGSRVRFSNNFIEDTRINGLNDFDNADREDYNDQYGDIMRTLFNQNRLYAFKYLRDTWIPVGQSIISQADGTQILGTSSKLLGQMQYFGYEGGIGNNPESLAVNASWIYHVMPNVGVVVRLGGDGVTPISEIYEVDNEIRTRIKEATKNKVPIFIQCDKETGSTVLSIGNYISYIYNGGFLSGNWKTNNDILSGVSYEIVDPPTNGTVTFTTADQITYTPDVDYVGEDSFTYVAIVGGVAGLERKECIVVTPIEQQYAWRPKESSYFCILEGGVPTGYKGWTTSEQYSLINGDTNGQEKPNSEGDSDYFSPIMDTVKCGAQSPNPFTFTDQSAVALSTQIESNTITITGITLPVLLSIVGGQYSKNGGAFTSAAGSAVNGDTIKVRVMSSSSPTTGASTTFTAGGVSDTFTVTTVGLRYKSEYNELEYWDGSYDADVYPTIFYKCIGIDNPVITGLAGINQTVMATDAAINSTVITAPSTGNYQIYFRWLGDIYIYDGYAAPGTGLMFNVSIKFAHSDGTVLKNYGTMQVNRIGGAGAWPANGSGVVNMSSTDTFNLIGGQSYELYAEFINPATGIASDMNTNLVRMSVDLLTFDIQQLT